MEGLKILLLGSVAEALPPKVLAMMAAKKAMGVIQAQSPEAEEAAMEELENVAALLAIGRAAKDAGGAEHIAADYEAFSKTRELQEFLEGRENP